MSINRRTFLQLAGGSLAALAAAKWPSTARPIAPLSVAPDESVLISSYISRPTVMTFTTHDPSCVPGRAINIDFNGSRLFSGVVRTVEIDVFQKARIVTAVDLDEFSKRREKDYGLIYTEQDASAVAKKMLDLYA